MILIGEKINGSIPSVAKAIAERNEDWIRNLAKIQTEAGADFIDVCASVKDNEVETLHWLIDLVQEVTDTPICIDSPDASVCVEAMKFCKKPGLINSVSMEGNKADIIFPAIAGTTWQCVALLCAKGIPQSAEERLTVFDQLMEKAKEYNIAPNRLHIDPLVEMLCTSEDGIAMVEEVIHTGEVPQHPCHRCCEQHLLQSARPQAAESGLPGSVYEGRYGFRRAGPHQPGYDGHDVRHRGHAGPGRVLHGVYRRLP